MVQNISVFLIFAAMASAARCAVAADTDEKMLQGEWELVSLEVQGKTLPAPGGKGGSIVFAKGEKLIWKDPGKPEKIGKYKIDAHREPKQIDLITSKDGETVQGIYAFDDDKLKMAFSAKGPKGQRPSDFKGENVMIVIWKRRKS
jgi:uncharacterized protein (TIGR03067 family)